MQSNHRRFAALCLFAFLAWIPSAARADSTRTVTAYASALVWGPWVTLHTHNQKAKVTITYTTLSDRTKVIGQVKYDHPIKSNDELKEFKNEIKISTSENPGKIMARFKGVPIEASVQVKVVVD